MKTVLPVGIWIAIVSTLIGGAMAQDAGSLLVSDTAVGARMIGDDGLVLISCSVNHTQGPGQIVGVAARIYHGNLITIYPTLYDDGTHGDHIADDGIFALEISAPRGVDQIRVVFSAVDKSRQEVESESLTVSLSDLR